MSKILDGKKTSEKILSDLKKETQKLNLKLAVVLVGENPASVLYIEQKKKACEKIGINFKLFKFNQKISTSALKKKVTEIVRKPDVSGLIVQLPLPKKINTQEILNAVSSEKDVDILSDKNLGKFYQGSMKFLPPTIAGIAELFKKYKIEIKGKNIVLIGTGILVGKPLSIWLLNKKATFSVVSSFTKDITFFTKKADILISGTGKPNLVKGNMVKKGAILIDCGSGRLRGKITGDMEFKSVSQKASFIAPVFGGIGPMTVAMLLWNLVKMNKK